jgi:uncharacterized protein (DUF1697 family)
MPLYVALLQGINIGSKKRIRMEALRDLIAADGGEDIRTYVNSGNVVFRHAESDVPALEARVEHALEAHIGLPVPVLVRTGVEMKAIVAANPFPDAETEPKTLHVLFLRSHPHVDNIDAADEIETGPDRFAVHGREVYFFLPNLMSGATLDMKQVQKVLNVGDATARNWNTVTKLAEMARA